MISQGSKISPSLFGCEEKIFYNVRISQWWWRFSCCQPNCKLYHIFSTMTRSQYVNFAISHLIGFPFLSVCSYPVLTVTFSGHQMHCEETNQICASFCLKIALLCVANGQCQWCRQWSWQTSSETVHGHPLGTHVLHTHKWHSAPQL